VPESRVLEWAIIQATRLRPPTDRVALAESTEAEQVALRARVDRLRVAFLAGLIDEPEMLAEKREIDEALTRLDLRGRVVTVPAIRWDREPREVNRALRLMWSAVQLDGDMRPVAADWQVPPDWIAPA